MKTVCSTLLVNAIGVQLALAPVAFAQERNAGISQTDHQAIYSVLKSKSSISELDTHISSDAITYSNETLKETNLTGSLSQLTQGLTFQMKESIQGKRYAIRYDAATELAKVNHQNTTAIKQINLTLFDSTHKLTPDSRNAENTNFIAKRSIWFQAGESAQTFYERVDGVRKALEQSLTKQIAANHKTSLKIAIAQKISSILIQNAMADWKAGLSKFIQVIVAGVLSLLALGALGLGLGIAFMCGLEGTMNNGKISHGTMILLVSSLVGGVGLCVLLGWTAHKIEKGDWWFKPKAPRTNPEVKITA